MHNRFVSSDNLSAPNNPGPVRTTGVVMDADPVRTAALNEYLLLQENSVTDITAFNRLLRMHRVILEIGCGSGNVALEIAVKNPDIGVIATDPYDWTVPAQYGSGYRETALRWKERQHEAQQDPPGNLVLLRANADLIPLLPPGSIDTVLLVNPEPSVARAFMNALKDPLFKGKIKPGEKQIVVLPFSREMGVASCGGCEFDHSGDWSRGLGFLMESGLGFRRTEPVQWRVELVKSSLYSCSSTQKDVYCCGSPAALDGVRQTAPGLTASWMKHLIRKVTCVLSDSRSRSTGTPGRPIRKPDNIE